MSLKLMQLYPFQVFRHRVYLPWLSVLGFWGDIKRGVTTQKIIELSELGIDSRAGTRFETIRYKSLQTILSCAQEEGFSKFLDIGCGLGRSLIVADELGFNDIYGVDISQALIESCQKTYQKKIFPLSLAVVM